MEIECDLEYEILFLLSLGTELYLEFFNFILFKIRFWVFIEKFSVLLSLGWININLFSCVSNFFKKNILKLG